MVRSQRRVVQQRDRFIQGEYFAPKGEPVTVRGDGSEVSGEDHRPKRTDPVDWPEHADLGGKSRDRK